MNNYNSIFLLIFLVVFSGASLNAMEKLGYEIGQRLKFRTKEWLITNVEEDYQQKLGRHSKQVSKVGTKLDLQRFSWWKHYESNVSTVKWQNETRLNLIKDSSRGHVTVRGYLTGGLSLAAIGLTCLTWWKWFKN